MKLKICLLSILIFLCFCSLIRKVYGVDTESPTYSKISLTITGGSNARFQTLWEDNATLDKFRFQWNESGTFVWENWIDFDSNPDYSIILKPMPNKNMVIGWKIQAKDEAGNNATIPLHIHNWIAPITPYPLGSWMIIGMGLCGFIMEMITPIYVIKKIKEGEWSDALCWGMLMFIIGIAFIIVWLWG
ncbi:MAG: DUF350 domain-containing protein [Candidatus Bathyarchaeota archaeon]|nr:DUF350 domain-containing protein [Candidatus Bathyarchaeota archaeon]